MKTPDLPRPFRAAEITQLDSSDWVLQDIQSQIIDLGFQDLVPFYRWNGIPIIFPHYDHEVGTIHTSLLETLIDENRCLGIVAEYFGPELKRNTHRAHPAYLPCALNVIQGRSEARDSFQRIFGLRKVVSIAKNAGLPIYTMDIANQPSYEAQQQLGNVLLGLALVSSLNADLVGLGVLLGLTQLVQRFAEAHQQGIYNPTTISPWERNAMWGHEDARRVFIAAGLSWLTTFLRQHMEIDPTLEHEEKALVVFYPQAHTRRIVEYGKHPHPLKQQLYRQYPDLEYGVRRHTWEEVGNEGDGPQLHTRQWTQKTMHTFSLFPLIQKFTR